MSEEVVDIEVGSSCTRAQSPSRGEPAEPEFPARAERACFDGQDDAPVAAARG
ncbi:MULTISPECIES: hypothetical protein [Streptomyces]|uniref:Uncharacterized protein n=2 Tax=Streptomyces TaxID=1883 RepID=A0ABV9IXC5_9ACTN